MHQIGSLFIQKGPRKVEAAHNLVSIGTGEDVDISFDRRWHPGVFPAHVCLRRIKNGLQICRLTPRAEVFENGRLLADRVFIDTPAVLQIGTAGPLIHLDFVTVGKEPSSSWLPLLKSAKSVVQIFIAVHKVLGGDVIFSQENFE